jgi:hypothetical protein
MGPVAPKEDFRMLRESGLPPLTHWDPGLARLLTQMEEDCVEWCPRTNGIKRSGSLCWKKRYQPAPPLGAVP